jgi:hypothetical protein
MLTHYSGPVEQQQRKLFFEGALCSKPQSLSSVIIIIINQ